MQKTSFYLEFCQNLSTKWKNRITNSICFVFLLYVTAPALYKHGLRVLWLLQQVSTNWWFKNNGNLFPHSSIGQKSKSGNTESKSKNRHGQILLKVPEMVHFLSLTAPGSGWHAS